FDIRIDYWSGCRRRRVERAGEPAVRTRSGETRSQSSWSIDRKHAVPVENGVLRSIFQGAVGKVVRWVKREQTVAHLDRGLTISEHVVNHRESRDGHVERRDVDPWPKLVSERRQARNIWSRIEWIAGGRFADLLRREHVIAVKPQAKV